MKKAFWLAAICSNALFCWALQDNLYQKATFVRMEMGECISSQPVFVTAMSGGTLPQVGGTCPQYTVVADTVVYLIVGKASEPFIPLAESIAFRIRNKDFVVRPGEAKRESRFKVKAMMLRVDWERDRQSPEEGSSNWTQHPAGTVTLTNRP